MSEEDRDNKDAVSMTMPVPVVQVRVQQGHRFHDTSVVCLLYEP